MPRQRGRILKGGDVHGSENEVLGGQVQKTEDGTPPGVIHTSELNRTATEVGVQAAPVVEAEISPVTVEAPPQEEATQVVSPTQAVRPRRQRSTAVTPQEVPPTPEQKKPIRLEATKEQPRFRLEMARGEEAQLNRYLEQSRLELNTREAIQQELSKEADEIRIRFAQRWFSVHQDELRIEGYEVDRVDDSYRMRLAKEKDAFRELDENPDYALERQKIEDVYALKDDLSKTNPPIESQLLALNRLNERSEGLRAEKQALSVTLDNLKAEKAGLAPSEVERLGQVNLGIARIEEEMKMKQREMDRLYGIRKEVYEKNLDSNAREAIIREEGIVPVRTKEEWVKYAIEQQGFMQDNDGSSARAYLSTTHKYEVVKKGWPFKRLHLRLLNPDSGEIIREIGSARDGDKTAKRLLFAKEAEKVLTEEAGRDWQEAKRKEEEKIREKFEGRMRQAGRFEGVLGGVEEMYKGVRERLISEFAEREISKEPKTKEVLAEIKSKFSGRVRAIDMPRIIREIYERDDERLSDITGDWADDANQIFDWFSSRRFAPDRGQFEEAIHKAEQLEGTTYASAAKKRAGLASLFLTAMLTIFASQETAQVGAV